MAGNRSQIPLREWINGALDSVDTSGDLCWSYGPNPRSLALTSESFLLSALKIAWSLADLIRREEEQQNGQHDVLPTPPPGTDWVDSCIVDLTPGSDAVQVPNLFAGATTTSYSYLSVVGAQFTASIHKSHGVINKNSIYSLGLVFYELFSGGVQPPGISRQKCEEDTTSRAVSLGSMSILDETQTEDDDVFGDLVSKILKDGERNRERNAKRQSVQTDGNASCAVSVEPLKTKMIPLPLCDLIANMLDCAKGDLSGDEAYSNISDVVIDLRLMLDKPTQYLHGPDIERIATFGLQLDDQTFGRETEYSTLMESYNRSISGLIDMAVISGPSGTGKTVLANKLGNNIASSGGLFMSGKFDQLKQPKPFSAIASAFDRYCDALIKEGEPGKILRIATELRAVLGIEAYHLVKVIPNLTFILGQDASPSVENRDCVNAQRRLQYLLGRFIEIISNSLGAPMALCLDDLQWADIQSVDLIQDLILTSGSFDKSNHFYFIGCYRDDEMNDDHPLHGLLSRVRHFGVNVSTVKLDCMDEGTINSVISLLLCCSPRLVRPLAQEIYHKTKGNHLFFSQLMVSLSKSGLLRLGLTRRRWEWDVEKIASQGLPDNVAEFFTSTIKKLPENVQACLFTLSCFGSRSEESLLKTLEEQIGVQLLEPLEVAVEEGLLNKDDGCYCFTHDRIQEASYSISSPKDRSLLHLKYGLALCSVGAGALHGSSIVLFAAAGQLNRAGSSIVTDTNQAVLITNLNFIAGNKAMEMSDFRSAHGFYIQGISFLPQDSWESQYDLTLQLYDSAAKCAFATGDMPSVTHLSEKVLTLGKTLLDKLNALYVTTSALAFASLPEAVNRAIIVLSELGEDLSEQSSESHVGLLLNNTQSLLSNITDEQLLQYGNMTDPFKITAMKFMSRLENSTQQIKPDLQPIVTLKMVNLSLSHGLSRMSPIAFTYYGVLLARRGNVKEGYRYVTIAKKLLEKLGSKEVAGEVIALGTQIACFNEPVLAANQSHLDGHAMGMMTGDINNALFNFLLHATVSYWGGVHLDTVNESCTKARQMLDQHNHLTWIINFVPIQRSVLLMVGTKDDVHKMTAVPEEDTLRGENPHALMVLHFQHFHVFYLFRQYEQMKSAAEKYFGYALKLNSWSLMYFHAAQSFMGGLVSFWIFRKTNDALWAERGVTCKSEIGKWSESCEWNFQSKFYLLEAEEYYSNCDYEGAMRSYDLAISSARRHRFINDEALALELAGHFLLEQGKRDTCLTYFLQAHSKYHEWGAIAKSNALFAFVQANVALPSASTESIEPIPIITSSEMKGHTGNGDNRKRASWTDSC